jgi:hypothetical protein
MPGINDRDWKTLYRVGGIAPLVAVFFYLTEMFAILIGGRFPTDMAGWYELFVSNRLLGLLYLNALDIFSIALLGVMFLALYVALRHYAPSWMTISLYFGLLGAAVFIVPRVLMLSIIPLSEGYAAASEAERALYIAAALPLQVEKATPLTTGFLFQAVAGMIISWVILKNRVFNKSTAIVGLAGGAVTIANDFSIVVASTLADMMMPVNGLLWLVWWLLVSRELLRLSRSVAKQEI